MTYDLDDEDLGAAMRDADLKTLKMIAEPTYTCNQCGTRGSIGWMQRHNCEHNQYVDENGGRCEDYPACGHTDGDGCRTLESHTSEYWHKQLQDLQDRGYDDHEIDMMLSHDD